MEKIASFTIDHIKLQPGVYVSRKDQVAGGVVTTFDLRMTSPNEEPVMNTAEVHTIEHPYVKHTTKKYNSEKQKTQATKMDLIAWGFCFCIVSYSKRSWTL